MAQAQAGLKAVLKIVKAENPGMIDAASAETSTAFGQTREATALESMCAVALKTESTMTEYTCVFVAMTVLKNPKLRMATQVGKGVRESLGSALATLNANRQTNIFKTEVEEIQVTLNDAVKANKCLILRPSASSHARPRSQ